MMSGGVVPVGNCLSKVWEMAVTCASAISILAFGWKKILMTAMPLSVWLSVCSISLTVVVKTRSNGVVMRPSKSEDASPVYWKTTETIGMLMFGKMSTGVSRMASALRMSSSKAATMKV